MIFKRALKCRRCGEVFTDSRVFDSKSEPPWIAELHEHKCSANGFGVADVVGYDNVYDYQTAESASNVTPNVEVTGAEPALSAERPR